jgi:hypothetical protein
MTSDYEKEVAEILKLCKEKRDFGVEKYKEEAFQNTEKPLLYSYDMLIQEHIDAINYNLEIIRQLRKRMRSL